jgi:hypothetical protein
LLSSHPQPATNILIFAGNILDFFVIAFCLYLSVKRTGLVALMGERRGVYSVSVRKSEGNRPFGRPRHRWKYNIKMGLQEVGYGGRD